MARTIRDLAKQLNLSITTVSRALDGYDDVAESTRQRVIKAANEMGYTPNRAARQLRRQRTDTIGYVLPAVSPGFSDPFFSEFISGLGDAAGELDFDLLVSTAPPGKPVEKELYERWINARKVDGFILNRMRLMDWRVQFLYRRHVPFVTLEKSRDQVEMASVSARNRIAFHKLVDHLISAGHKRIGYVGGPSELVIQADRYAGYLDALKAAGLSFIPELVVESNLTRQCGFEAATKLLSLNNPPTAIACVNDLTAVGVLEAAHSRGLVIGRDFAVAGFDGIEEAAHTRPPLTTVYQPVYEIAKQLASMLIQAINSGNSGVSLISIEPELVIRQSTTG
jgi:LacI family transcriptional regulator